jgi:uncharacterized damage-inducible protein DinB
MNYYGAKELAASYRLVRKNTLVIAEEIGEEHYGFSASGVTRTVAQTLVHIALSHRLQYHWHGVEHRSNLEGFDFPAFFLPLIEEEKTPRSKQQILTMLKEDGEKFGSWLESLSDEFLGETVTFPAGMTPPSKSRFEMILGVKEHEMHHRAQLMVLQRMIGLEPHLTREMNARFAAMMAARATA